VKLLAALLLYGALLMTGLVAGWLAGTPQASLHATLGAAPVLLLLVPRAVRARVWRGLVGFEAFLFVLEERLWKRVQWLGRELAERLNPENPYL